MGALHPGDYIATPRKLEVSEEQSGDRDQLRVLAYLLADGSLSAKGATADFISKDTRLIEAYQESLGAFDSLEPRTLQQVRDVTRVMVAGVDKTHYHQTNSLVAALRGWKLKTKTAAVVLTKNFVPGSLNQQDIAFF